MMIDMKANELEDVICRLAEAIDIGDVWSINVDTFMYAQFEKRYGPGAFVTSSGEVNAAGFSAAVQTFASLIHRKQSGRLTYVSGPGTKVVTILKTTSEGGVSDGRLLDALDNVLSRIFTYIDDDDDDTICPLHLFVAQNKFDAMRVTSAIGDDQYLVIRLPDRDPWSYLCEQCRKCPDVNYCTRTTIKKHDGTCWRDEVANDHES